MFVYGSQYYRPPNPPRSERRGDIERIRALGFNTIKVWAMWNWVNTKPGSYDTEELDELLELAQRSGLKVVINTILENAPYWLFDKYPEARYVNAQGQSLDGGPIDNTPSGGWPGLCLDHEGMREEAARYLSSLGVRFRDHPALLCWDVWNEPHLEPLSRPSSLPDGSLYCYCESSKKRYTSWLKARYADIEVLNARWGTRYSRWEDIKPTRVWGGYPHMVEWLRFWQENLADWMKFRVAAMKSVDTAHPVMSHEGPDGVISDGLFKYTFDEWKVAEEVDRWGCSSFPGWARTDHCLTALHFDIAASAARGKECWLSELQGDGAHDTLSIFRHDSPDLLEMAAWNLIAVATGMKGILYWQYRAELLGPESPGFGLTSPDGSSTERTKMAARLAQMVTRIPAFREARPPKPRVGIVHSKVSQTFLYAARRQEQPLRQSTEGIYRAFWEANIPVAFVVLDRGLDGLSAYNALYYPFPLSMSTTEGRVLVEYVESGGTLVAECHVAQYDELGRASEVVPGQGLDELFGARRKDGFRINCERVKLDRGELIADGYHEVLELLGGTAHGRWPDGSPVFVENHRGKGRAILFSSLVFGDPLNASFLVGLTPEGVKPAIDVEPLIFARRLDGPPGRIVILVNTRDGPVEAKLECESAGLGVRVEDIWNERAVELRGGRLHVPLPARGSAVLVPMP